MESLLNRGEKLDDLVQKSEHLGNQSKAFYKTVRNEPTTETSDTSLNITFDLDIQVHAFPVVTLYWRVCVFNFPQARKQNSCCEIM